MSLTIRRLESERTRRCGKPRTKFLENLRHEHLPWFTLKFRYGSEGKAVSHFLFAVTSPKSSGTEGARDHSTRRLPANDAKHGGDRERVRQQWGDESWAPG